MYTYGGNTYFQTVSPRTVFTMLALKNIDVAAQILMAQRHDRTKFAHYLLKQKTPVYRQTFDITRELTEAAHEGPEREH